MACGRSGGYSRLICLKVSINDLYPYIACSTEDEQAIFPWMSGLLTDLSPVSSFRSCQKVGS